VNGLSPGRRARCLLLEEREDTVGIIRGDHRSHPDTQVENESLLLPGSAQIQWEPVTQVPRSPQAALPSPWPHAPWVHALDLGIEDVLACAKGEVVSPNGETIGIELDETIVIKGVFHRSRDLLFERLGDQEWEPHALRQRDQSRTSGWQSQRIEATAALKLVSLGKPEVAALIDPGSLNADALIARQR